MYVTRMPTPAADSLTPTGALPPTLRPAVASGGFWLVWLQMVLARWAERQQLLALEERELRDIGLTQAEAWALAQKPLWRR